MAPGVESATYTLPVINGKANGASEVQQASRRLPLKKSGALDSAFQFDEVTPVIGREYPTTNIVEDLLNSSNADELLRDLAITSKTVRAIIL